MATVTADSKRRVPLPQARPGERFDVKIENGVYLLAPLVPAKKEKMPEKELRRLIKSIKMKTHLSAEEARAAVKAGRA
jgi:hypothetical protein